MNDIYNEITERLRKAQLNLEQLEPSRAISKIFEEGRIFELEYLKKLIELMKEADPKC